MLLLLSHFSVSIEVFATMTAFGATAFALALLFLAAPDRVRTRYLGRSIIAAYLLATVVLSPYLYYVFAFPGPSTPNPAEYVSDLLILIVDVGTDEAPVERIDDTLVEPDGFLDVV